MRIFLMLYFVISSSISYAQPWHNVRVSSRKSWKVNRSYILGYGLSMKSGHEFTFDLDLHKVYEEIHVFTPIGIMMNPNPSYFVKEIEPAIEWRYIFISTKEGKQAHNGFKWLAGATIWSKIQIDIDDDFLDKFLAVRGVQPSDAYFRTIQEFYIGIVGGVRYLSKYGFFVELKIPLGLDLVPWIVKGKNAPYYTIGGTGRFALGYRFGWYEKEGK